MIEKIRKEEYDTRLQKIGMAQKQNLIKHKEKNKKLHVVYVMSHNSVCGAAKIILEHTNRLWEIGVKVSIVSYFEKPTWYPVKANYNQVPYTIKLSMCIPKCDIIVATYYTHIQECIETGIAPVVYFEQGDYHLFRYEQLKAASKAFIKTQYSLPKFIFTVSNEVKKIILNKFNRKVYVIHNAIDHKIFNTTTDSIEKSENYILMMGQDDLEFKGVRYIIKAYEKVKEFYPDLKVYWITPYLNKINLKNKVDQVFIQPTQQEIASLYRNATMFISYSSYESFSLPILEALSCGCPVITTDSIGIRDYITNNENVLITEREINCLANKIIELLEDHKLRKKIIENGLKTASNFHWTKSIKKLYQYYKEIAEYSVKRDKSKNEWKIYAERQDFINQSEFDKLIDFIHFTSSNIVYAPMIYKPEENLEMARWEIIACKEKSECDSPIQKEYIYCKIRAKERFEDQICYKEDYTSYKNKYFDRALIGFRNKYMKENNESIKVIYLRWMILCLIHLNRYEEALIYVKKSLENHEHNADLYYLKGLILLNTKEYDELQTIYKKVNYLSDAVAYEEYFVGVINKVKLLLEESINVKENIISEELDIGIQEILLYVNQLIEHELYNEAINYCKQFLNDFQDKESLIIINRKIAKCFYDKAEYSVARQYCYTNFQFDKPRAEECCLIGLTYFKEKKIDRAIYWYELATTLKIPKDALGIEKKDWTWKPHLQLCICYYEKGDVEESFKHNEIAKAMNPNNKNIIHNSKFFRSLGYF